MKRCHCGRQAIVKGAGGTRACVDHVAELDAPRWLRLPDEETGREAGPEPTDARETVRELVGLGALRGETLETVDEALAALDSPEADARLDEMLAEAQRTPPGS